MTSSGLQTIGHASDSGIQMPSWPTTGHNLNPGPKKCSQSIGGIIPPPPIPDIPGIPGGIMLGASPPIPDIPDIPGGIMVGASPPIPDIPDIPGGIMVGASPPIPGIGGIPSPHGDGDGIGGIPSPLGDGDHGDGEFSLGEIWLSTKWILPCKSTAGSEVSPWPVAKEKSKGKRTRLNVSPHFMLGISTNKLVYSVSASCRQTNWFIRKRIV